MIGTTLGDIRDHIESLASDDGEYTLVCSRYGDRPVPAAELRFPNRATARAAAQAAEQYRAALRRYDPRLPYHDVIVQQNAPRYDGGGPSDRRSSDRSNRVEPDIAGRIERHELVEFCHRTAAAVFETLSEAGYDAVETAVMDRYFDLAESISEPDDLCLCLLEGMAVELDTRLDPTAQRDVLSAAARRLSSPIRSTDGEPVAATLAYLRDRGVLRGSARSSGAIEPDDGVRSVVVELSEYALTPHDGRLPTLPLVVELSRRRSEWLPAPVRVEAIDDGWRIRFAPARETDPIGVVGAPIVADR
ncbi:hypothetical protein C448_06528 [Halococcus morrhuae DSM 1307]|uniref:Uncharacterized protein n=1 Tax=Halococcus morrhuae DSM 1307 TaxID=931277 RepID=M0MPM8_HALMO|nr:hypothetical protein [Halococcus morrhuae]EMA46415.1 hypothetical protein C448_06528 [Halococcus morrhuae DSM 1307]